MATVPSSRCGGARCLVDAVEWTHRRLEGDGRAGGHARVDDAAAGVEVHVGELPRMAFEAPHVGGLVDVALEKFPTREANAQAIGVPARADASHFGVISAPDVDLILSIA
jgi:hypothetical protein